MWPGPTTPVEPKPVRFGLFRVRSPLLTESLICFLFLEVLRWFTSLGSPLPAYEFSWRSLDMTPVGLPHSEIPGSMRACRSPRLIAAGCVLHRLSVPRHPPSTLSNLTIKCLDLMRSAVRTSCDMLVHLLSTTTQYSIVNERLDREDRRCPQHSVVISAELRACGPDFGGADRVRTDDPLLAKQVLSQLSYTPSTVLSGQRPAPRSLLLTTDN